MILPARRGVLIFVLTLAAGCGPLLAPAVLAGTTIKYPRHDPAFTLEVPDGWTATETTANLVHPLDFRPKKGWVDYSVQILYLSVADVSDRKGFVRDLAAEQVRSAGMKNANYEPPGEEKMRHGLLLTAQIVRGKLGGVDYAYVFVLFVVKNQGYILAVNGPVATLDEGTKVADEISGSVRPLAAK